MDSARQKAVANHMSARSAQRDILNHNAHKQNKKPLSQNPKQAPIPLLLQLMFNYLNIIYMDMTKLFISF